MDAPQHLLVGYDGSPLSDLALHSAFRLVNYSPFALIHVVAVVAERDDWHVRLPTGPLMTRWAALDSIRYMVASATEQLRTRCPRIRVIAHLRSGDPAQSLVDFAYRFHIDQIVLGAHGHGGRTPLGLGSVANKVLELTEIPVQLESPILSVPPTSSAALLRWADIVDTKSDVTSNHPFSFRARALA